MKTRVSPKYFVTDCRRYDVKIWNADEANSKWFQFQSSSFPLILNDKYLWKHFICMFAYFTVDKFVICPFVQEIAYILSCIFAWLLRQIRKQPSPIPCNYLKVLINLQANVNFNFRTMRLSWLIDLQGDSATFKLVNR